MKAPVCYLHLRPMKAKTEDIPGFVKSCWDAVKTRTVYRCPVRGCYVCATGKTEFRWKLDGGQMEESYMKTIMGGELYD